MRLVLALLFAILAFVFSRGVQAAPAELVVYTYDSLASKSGWAPIVVKHFEASQKAAGQDVKVKLVVVGDAVQILSRVKLDLKRKKPLAHVAWGIDLAVFSKMKDIVLPLKASEFAPLASELGVPDAGFVPFDYGVFAFIQDTKKLAWEKRPTDWKDLLDPRFKKTLLLQDPRTSTAGLAFVSGSSVVMANAGSAGFGGFAPFWKSLKPQWLTLSPGWTQAYGMFLKEEAPLVWSYITSQAYHREEGDTTERYRAVVFPSGNPIQVEGLSILASGPGGEKMKTLARAFVAAALSAGMQEKLPKTQWMMPARKDVKIPDSFKNLPKPTKILNPEVSATALDRLLSDWSAAIR